MHVSRVVTKDDPECEKTLSQSFLFQIVKVRFSLTMYFKSWGGRIIKRILLQQPM